MKILIVLCLFAATLAFEDSLQAILRSPKETIKLYRNFKAQEHLNFGGNEDRRRFQMFLSTAKFVADANEHSDSAEFGLNFFSTMTEDEKKQYLGLNITGQDTRPTILASPSSFQAPIELLWTDKKAVTKVKNQGGCGSCWTFGAVGGLETRYQQLSGVLRNFAEQEYLDCTYGEQRNGCRGGWPNSCYNYSARNGGRLASTANYPYTRRSGTCQASSKPDAAVAYKISGKVNVGKTETSHINALASGSLSVAFKVTKYFTSYKRGILKDTSCKGGPNHAVVAVGYTATYVLVKNSWGSRWGDQGFVKFARGHRNCGLFRYGSYPKLTSTGKADSTPSDPAADYKHDDE